MKQKLTKISEEDFNGLLPSTIPPPEPLVSAASESDKTTAEAASTVETTSTIAKASKLNKVKPATASGISIRLTFSTQDYKSLTMLALTESDKIGKRVSVTSLLSTQANKLIKKGATNA